MNIPRARWFQLNRILVVDENREAQKKAFVFRNSRMLVCFRVLVDSATDFNRGIFEKYQRGVSQFPHIQAMPLALAKVIPRLGGC